MKNFDKTNWYEGICGEYIFVYNPIIKLLLIEYDGYDYTDILNRIILSVDDNDFKFRADKIVRNVEFEELEDAVAAVVFKDSSFGYVDIDWSNKKAVKSFIEA